MSTIPSTVYVKWINSTMMMGLDSTGRNILIGKDLESTPEWIGLKPSDLLLLAAASCTAYDVITILIKQRQPVVGLEIICTGEQLNDPPNSFVSIKLKYLVKGKIDEDKLIKAINLSEEKYCSVLSTLKAGLSIESTYEFT